MTGMAQAFSKKQIYQMKDICRDNISFVDIVKSRTKVLKEGTKDWKLVQCEFHPTNTTDAGRLKDHFEDHEGKEEGVYFCNNTACSTHQSPWNGRLNMFQYWQLAQGFDTEEEAIIDLYSNTLGRELPEPDGSPLSEEEKKQIEKEQRNKFLFLHVLYFYHKTLLSEEGEEGLKYLHEERKIPMEYIKAFYLGYAPYLKGSMSDKEKENARKRLRNYLEEVGFTQQEIKEAGFINEQGFDTYWGRIFIPLSSLRSNFLDPNFNIQNATIENFYSRMLNGLINDKTKGLKHRYLNNKFPLFNFSEARKKKMALMVEGAIDTISSQVFIDRLVRLEKEDKIPAEFTIQPSNLGAFATYGTNGFSEREHIPLLQKANFDILFLAGDNDKNFAGQTSNIKLARLIQKHSPNTMVRIVNWTKNDVNEMLVNDINELEFLECLENSVSLEEFEILVSLQKSGDKEILRNQFEALHRIEDMLLNLNLNEENSLLRYKKTLITVSNYIGIDVETILLHILLVKHKNDLLNVAKESKIPLETLLTSELAVIRTVFN